MAWTTAMTGSDANVTHLRAIGRLCQQAGLRVLEAGGWTTRGHDWAELVPEYVVAHHTAAEVDIDRLLIEGRADLPGPLCNLALHADGTVVLIASGTANHAGVATISSAQAWGIEATGPIPTGNTGVDAFPNYQAYLTLCAAIRIHHGWPAERVVGHKEIARPDGRKIDPAFGSAAPAPYPDMARFRVLVDRRVAAWGAKEDDMTTEELLDALDSDRGQAILRKAVTQVLRVAVGPDDGRTPAGVYFDGLASQVNEIEVGQINLATKVEEIHQAVVEPPA